MQKFSEHILLDYGSGGKASQRLIQDFFFKHFANPILCKMDDAALLKVNGPIAMSTDSYTVTPLFFPGGSIGTLAIHGTVNDVAMLGARVKYLSCAFIIEEGFAFSELERIIQDMAKAAKEAKILIVTGDTKVVPRNMCDKIFINTTGIGEILVDPAPSGSSAQAGDIVIISGTMGDHGLTIMTQREGFNYSQDIASDSASLNGMIESLVLDIGDIHVLRDPTRGGLATTLNEIAEQSAVVINIKEKAIPVRECVRGACSILGLDPLYLANEGKLICIVPEAKAEKALKLMQSHKYGQDAAIIGSVQAKTNDTRTGQVILETNIGGKRLLSMLEGAQLPRIC